MIVQRAALSNDDKDDSDNVVCPILRYSYYLCFHMCERLFERTDTLPMTLTMPRKFCVVATRKKLRRRLGNIVADRLGRSIGPTGYYPLLYSTFHTHYAEKTMGARKSTTADPDGLHLYCGSLPLLMSKCLCDDLKFVYHFLGPSGRYTRVWVVS
jgi:hypothetical protein